MAEARKYRVTYRVPNGPQVDPVIYVTAYTAEDAAFQAKFEMKMRPHGPESWIVEVTPYNDKVDLVRHAQADALDEAAHALIESAKKHDHDRWGCCTPSSAENLKRRAEALRSSA